MCTSFSSIPRVLSRSLTLGGKLRTWVAKIVPQGSACELSLYSLFGGGGGGGGGEAGVFGEEAPFPSR